MVERSRIAIVTPYGAEPRLDNYAEFILAEGLVARGYEVRFHTYQLKGNAHYQPQSTTYKSVPTFRCSQRLGISVSLFRAILRFQPDVVLFFHPRSLLNFSAYWAARLCGAKVIAEIVGILHDPYVVTDRDDPVTTLKKDVRLFTRWSDIFKIPFSRRPVWQWKNLIFHAPTAHADAIVAINRDEQNYVKRFYGRDSELIYWSIRTGEERAEAMPPQEKYGSLPDNYVLLIAQIKKRKGWDTVVEAIAHLKKQGVRKNLIFVCPTPNIAEAQGYAAKLGVSDQIFFLTQISNEEKNWLLSHAQCVLAPSRYEGFGLPVFEGFQAGRPVLATDIPVYLEFLEHKKNALISRTGDGRRLAENIALLDQEPLLAHNLIAEGYKTAEAFSDRVMVGKFEDLIASLVSRNGSGASTNQ